MPTNPEATPAIYIAAGSGLAPFRGFIQERAMMLSAKHRTLAPALFFFGCRSPDEDDIYREQLDEWEAQGVVQVVRAYSRAPERSDGCKHVDDAMWKHRDRLVELWKKGAKVYVCGSRGVSESVREAVIKIGVEQCGGSRNADEAATREWFEGLRNVRYVMDVFD
jgi:cytochrome P450/NADPH-cytochrome P450 reductase